MRKILIAGIGTDVGKTIASAILVEALDADYWKPIQCSHPKDSEIVASLVQKKRTIHQEALSLEAPCSPHLAANLEGFTIDPTQICLPKTSKTLVIEGCGGILVPLNYQRLTLDLFASWDCEWVVVSQNYLGSINHSLLTLEAMQRRSLPIKGIIFNGDKNPSTEKAILTFSKLPCIARINQEKQWTAQLIHNYAMEWKKTKSLSMRDAAVIWHPFTQMQTHPEAIGIVRAKGSHLFAEDGSAYLDAVSSWWVNLHGHSHPYIAAKIAEQAKVLEHVMFAGFTHKNAVELAERLTKLTGFDKLFYSDNGSTAVETALKIALQFWHNKSSQTKKKKFLSLKGGYHGDTFGAMSASGKNLFNQPFWDHLFPIKTIDPPFFGKEEQFLNSLQKALQSQEIAAFIFEPQILGAGGMKIYSLEALEEGIKLCKKMGALTIADEVMTGFGRTGPLFVCDQLLQKPDLLCLSKGITGGFLPLGATLCKQEIFEAFLSTDPAKALLHGHSYSGNPLACTAALASLDLLLTDQCLEKRNWIAASHRSFCSKFHSHPSLIRCEALGTILILEYSTSSPTGYLNSKKEELTRYFLSENILLRPFGNTVHVIPPYCITKEELNHIYTHLIHSLKEPL